MRVPFTDGLSFRSDDIWNLPLQKFDDRWDLFNYIVENYVNSSDKKFSDRDRCSFLELGVWTAGTLPRLAGHFGNIFDFTGVDPYGMLVDDPYKGTFWHTTAEAESVYQSAKAIFDRHDATLVRKSSKDFFDQDSKEYDIIFVDGDHRYAGALSDCTTGFERLRSGGLMIVDDIGNSFHPEVEWAFRAFIGTHAGKIRRMGAHPLFFQLEGMPVPVVLIFAYVQKA